MIVLLAAAGSPVVRAARCGRLGLAVLTPADLSMDGWVLDPADPRAGTAVVAGRRVANRDLDLVITALDAVWPADLPQVASADRVFVAEEMTAFLRTWLDGLGQAVLDPPTPTSLAGPAVSAATWRAAARDCGMDYAPPAAPAAGRPPGQLVPVAYGRCLIPVPPQTAAIASRLAAAAGLRACALMLAETAAGAPNGRALLGAPPWWEATPRAVLTAVARQPAAGGQAAW